MDILDTLLPHLWHEFKGNKTLHILCVEDDESAKERLEIILECKKRVQEQIQKLQDTLPTLDFKVDYYKKLLARQKGDLLNPLSSDYDNPCGKKRKKIVKDY